MFDKGPERGKETHKTSRLVSAEKVSVGMVLASDAISDKSSDLFIRAGTILTEYHVGLLKIWGIPLKIE